MNRHRGDFPVKNWAKAFAAALVVACVFIVGGLLVGVLLVWLPFWLSALLLAGFFMAVVTSVMYDAFFKENNG